VTSQHDKRFIGTEGTCSVIGCLHYQEAISHPEAITPLHRTKLDSGLPPAAKRRKKIKRCILYFQSVQFLWVNKPVVRSYWSLCSSVHTVRMFYVSGFAATLNNSVTKGCALTQ